MSLITIIRTNDGSIFAATDTALSAEVNGISYRIANQEEYDKIIVHPDGTIMFAAGHLKCAKAVRDAAFSMETIDILKLQEYARLIFEPSTVDDNMGVILCLPDGTIKKMAAQENFEIEEVELDHSGTKTNLFTFGYCSREALKAMEEAINSGITRDIDIFGKVFNTVLCEEVGGHLRVFRRCNGEVTTCTGVLTEPDTLRWKTGQDCTPDVKYKFHAMIKASQIDASTINASTINVATLNGELTAGTNGGAIVGTSINVGDGKFEVDSSGNCNIQSGTFTAPTISGGKISGTEIHGVNIYGGTYHDESGDASLEISATDGVGTAYSELKLGRGDTVHLTIQCRENRVDGSTYVSISADSTIKPQGDWDFSGANVDGVVARFGA
jgi:hypothetical protein